MIFHMQFRFRAFRMILIWSEGNGHGLEYLKKFFLYGRVNVTFFMNNKFLISLMRYRIENI